MNLNQFSEAFQGSFSGAFSGHARWFVSVSGKFYGVSYDMRGVSGGEGYFLIFSESLGRRRGCES